jgi:hypothetical protein
LKGHGVKQAAEKGLWRIFYECPVMRFVTGHDFSRAEEAVQ